MQLTSKYCTLFLPAFQNEYDLVISYAWPHDSIASKVKAKKKIAWIHTDYSILEIDNKLDLLVWSKFDYIASISDTCTESFLATYPSLENKLILIENISSPEFIKKMAEKTDFIGFDNTSFTIVSVGRLSYPKGFDLAVRALKVLHDQGLTHIKWYVVGYGSCEAELKALILELRLEGSFILLGKKTNPYPYIKQCDLYVQPSRYEGKAVTVTEAKILGKPIVITNYPTAQSQLKDGIDGFICSMGVNGVVEGIKKMIEDVEFRNRISKNARDSHYGNETEVKKIYQLIQ